MWALEKTNKHWNVTTGKKKIKLGENIKYKLILSLESACFLQSLSPQATQ